jgi:hypothetical protein
LLDEHNIEVDHFRDAYLVDISNDGNPKYVFTRSEGSMGYLGLAIFEKSGGGFKFVTDELPKPAAITTDGPWYSWEYINQLTHKPELFVELCGKTYLSINNGTYQDPIREIFIWERAGIRRACTTEWAAVHRKFFNQLYEKQNFEAASSYLRGVLDACGMDFPREQRISMENDEALAAFKKGDPASCLMTLTRVKADKEFQLLPQELKSAVTHNEKLCSHKAEADQAAGNAGQYDYSWLLNFKGKTTNDVFWDRRFNGLLSAVVPNAKSSYSADPGAMKADLKARLGGPPGDIEIKAGRYLVLSACMAHSCGDKGMIWIDTQKKRSALAIGSNASVTVASRSIKTGELPAELLVALKGWAKAEGLQLGSTMFYDFSGKADDISPLLK